MSLSLTVELAEMVCRFEHFGCGTFCDSWQWKLDTYRSASSDEGRYDIIFRNQKKEEEIPDPIRKVYEIQDGFFLRTVSVLPGGGTLWRCVRKLSGEALLSYAVNHTWSEIVLVEDRSVTAGQMAFEYLGHIFPACGLMKDMLTFHGVLLEYSGYGLIISAPSGTGKTTHARLWRDRKRALIINGDRAACRKKDGIWTGFGIPWSGTSGEQINRSVHIKAVVVLERGGENCAFRITEQEAFGAVLPHVQCPAWDAQLTGRMLGLLDDFLRNIPVIRLRCLPDGEAVDVLAKAVEDL